MPIPYNLASWQHSTCQGFHRLRLPYTISYQAPSLVGFMIFMCPAMSCHGSLIGTSLLCIVERIPPSKTPVFRAELVTKMRRKALPEGFLDEKVDVSEPQPLCFFRTLLHRFSNWATAHPFWMSLGGVCVSWLFLLGGIWTANILSTGSQNNRL